MSAALSASASTLLEQAWRLCYQDLDAARALGQELVALGGLAAHYGWLHVGMAEVRLGQGAAGREALALARRGFGSVRDSSALALCDEVEAIQLRLEGNVDACLALQQSVDKRAGVERDALHTFIAHNSRALTHKLLGQVETALAHFHAASEAAERSGFAGPITAALTNLGSYHQELFNLDDALAMTERALVIAGQLKAHTAATLAAANLISTHHALGRPEDARRAVDLTLEHGQGQMPETLRRHGLQLALGHIAVGEFAAAERYLNQFAQTSLADGDRTVASAWLRGHCLLARGDSAGARALCESALQSGSQRRTSDLPYDLMQLHEVLAQACQALGDDAAALACVRRAHALYVQLVGRSTKARYVAIEVNQRLGQARLERDRAIELQRATEADRAHLAELNAALHAQIEQTRKLHERLREQALTDPLTGLHNRRFLFEVSPGVLELARRQEMPLCVALLDLDHFKLLNDTFGHEAGDRVLQRFALLMQNVLRGSDVICRYGGEEFVVVLPDLSVEDAQSVLGRLLEALQNLPPESGRRRLPKISFSAGVASFPRHGSTIEQLLLRADKALYTAKNQGRARIEFVPSTSFGTLA
jgi:diguanylate cyclase (GGDEF)-like protein